MRPPRFIRTAGIFRRARQVRPPDSGPGPELGSAALGVALVAFTAKGHTVSHPRGPVSLTSEITTGIAFVIFFAVYGLYRRWIRGGD